VSEEFSRTGSGKSGENEEELNWEVRQLPSFRGPPPRPPATMRAPASPVPVAPDGRDTRQNRRLFEQWRSSPRWSPFRALLMLAGISAAGAVSSSYLMPAARTAPATRFLETLRIVLWPGSAQVEAKLANTSPHHAAQAQAPQPAATRPPISPALAAIALARGDELMRLGDVASARRFYEIAADAAISGAAWSLARSYDPSFLHRIGAVGVQGDAAKAAHWYQRAAELGARAPAAP
jgi:hypothetical protein